MRVGILKMGGEVMINKKQFRIFTIVDLDKKEEYLHEMHLKGWRYRTSRGGVVFFLPRKQNQVNKSRDD